jgi:hypothetical protein
MYTRLAAMVQHAYLHRCASPRESRVEEQHLKERLQASLGANYTLERELGGGGMSRVFVATEITLGRLACDPTYDALKADPRFVAMMAPTGMRICAAGRGQS